MSMLTAGLMAAIFDQKYMGAVDTAVSTDWNDFSSSDFFDSTTGAQLPVNLRFEWISVDNADGTGRVYYKLRQRAAAGDPVTNEASVSATLVNSLSVRGINDLLTISLKKSVGADTVKILAGFGSRTL